MFNIIPYHTNHNIANREGRGYFEDFANDFFRPFFGRPEMNSFRVDVKDEGDHYLLEADMPGFKKEDIHVDLDENLLTIFVDNDETKEEKNENGFVIHERRTGRMSRAFNVEGIDKEGIQAAYQDGVLKLTLPKEQPQPKETKRTIAIC